jgi:hypothetical protein
MDPDHNREARLACKATRAGNVQVETLGLDFLQMLSGTLVAGEGKEFLLICFAFWLWADGPVASGIGRGAIGGEELCLTKAGRDGSILDASVLVYWEFGC